MKEKLILFDIDGTLIQHLGVHEYIGWPRFIYAIKRVFGIEVHADTTGRYRGWIDRQICWDLVRSHGITKEEYDREFPHVAFALHDFAREQEKSGVTMYHQIDDAVMLAKILSGQKNISLGLITGNVERMGWWKLEHAGITDLFTFGLFGDDVDDKQELAKTVQVKAKRYFHHSFEPNDIVIIGDSLDDIKSAHAIGATTISVTTGGHARKELEIEHPDLLVDSLMDERVLTLLGLKQ